jgi:hypothetical protein
MATANLRPRRSDAAVFAPLEDRRLLSVSLTHTGTAPTSSVVITPITILPTPTPIPTPISPGGVLLHEKVGVPFTAVVGTFTTIAPGTNLHATIRWGDGTSASVGTITAIGVIGIDEIKFSVTGSHTYAKAGTFPITTIVTQSGPAASTTPVRLVTTIHSVAVVSAKSNLKLDGTISGRYSLAPTAITVGAGYVFNGTGSAGAMGPVQATGFVTLPSPVAATPVGAAVGNITLTTIGASPLPGGSVTLHVVGPSQTSSDPFPTTLRYTITGGTGAFANASGSGIINVSLDPTTMKFTFTIVSA